MTRMRSGMIRRCDGRGLMSSNAEKSAEPAVVGFMLAYGLGAYVLHTFALTFLIASFALWFVGIETKGLVLEQITAKTKAT